MLLSRWLALPLAVASLSSARLPILENQYAAARAQALARHVPRFVDVWAPW